MRSREQGLRGRFMDRREGHGRRGPVAKEGLHEALRPILCRLWIGKACLGWERVVVQPIEQLGARAGQHIELGGVHMRVDEAGQHQAPGVIDTAPFGPRRLRLHRFDALASHQQPMVGPPTHLGWLQLTPSRLAGKVQEVATQGPGVVCHLGVGIGRKDSAPAGAHMRPGAPECATVRIWTLQLDPFGFCTSRAWWR